MLDLKIDKDRLRDIAVPLLFVLANLLLKLRYIKYPAIARDEPFTIYFSQFDVWTIIRELSQGNNPPLFEIILHFWTKMFGISELSVRFLPCLFSSLSVFFIYRIAQKFFNVKAAVLASLLFTLSTYHVYFAHETRVYPMFLLLTCVSMYAFLSLIKQPEDKRFGVLLTISNALLIYSHFFGFFVLALQFFATISLAPIRKTVFKKMFRSWAIVLVVYLPYLGILIRNFLKSVNEGTWVPPVTSLGQLHDFVNVLINGNKVTVILFYVISWLLTQRFIKKIPWKPYFKHVLTLISIIAVLYSISIVEGTFPLFWEINAVPPIVSSYLLFVVLLLILAMTNRQLSTSAKVVALWFFFPTLIMFVTSFWIPMFIDRYLIFTTPGFYLLIGIGLASIEYKLSLSLLLLILMGTTFHLDVSNERDVRLLVGTVLAKQDEKPKTAFYMCPDHFEFNFAYYYNRDYFTDIDNDDPKGKLLANLASDNIFPIFSFEHIDTALVNEMDQVVFIDAAADFSYPHNGIRAFLSERYPNPSVIDIKPLYKIYTFDIHQAKKDTLHVGE